MSRLGAELGITGNGLAKICDRLKVPYPPRGYWAKKEAGKPVVTFKLPGRPDGIPDWVDIHPTPHRPEPLPQIQASVIHGLDDFLGHLLGVAEQHHGAVEINY